MSGLEKAFNIHTIEQLHELVHDANHGHAIRQHRAGLIARRVQFFALAFALLVPAWVLVDAAVLPWHLTLWLLVLRLAAGLCFGLIAWQAGRCRSLGEARVLLVMLLLLPTTFYLLSDPLIARFHLVGWPQALASIYGLLPIVVIAGLSIFPLTLLELLGLALPVLGAAIVLSLPEDVATLPQVSATWWSLMLILGVAVFSSLSQLRYMISQVSRVTYDQLTGALTRRAGIETIDLNFRLTNLQGQAFTVLFIDLDHFKLINDNFGHQVGDHALRSAAQAIRDCLRKGDSLIRWGGEEFIVVLPNASCEESMAVVERIMSQGLGVRPDGVKITASIGLADSQRDGVNDWMQVVDLADRRMYQAKQSGRGRSVDCEGRRALWPGAEEPELP